MKSISGNFNKVPMSTYEVRGTVSVNLWFYIRGNVENFLICIAGKLKDQIK